MGSINPFALLQPSHHIDGGLQLCPSTGTAAANSIHGSVCECDIDPAALRLLSACAISGVTPATVATIAVGDVSSAPAAAAIYEIGAFGDSAVQGQTFLRNNGNPRAWLILLRVTTWLHMCASSQNWPMQLACNHARHYLART